MPWYDYKCDKCNHESDDQNTAANRHRPRVLNVSPKVKLVVNSVRFSLKGMGWAKDRYRATQRETYAQASKVGEASWDYEKKR